MSCKSAYHPLPYQHALESELLVVTRNEITLLASHIAEVVSLLPFATLLPRKSTFAGVTFRCRDDPAHATGKADS